MKQDKSNSLTKCRYDTNKVLPAGQQGGLEVKVPLAPRIITDPDRRSRRHLRYIQPKHTHRTSRIDCIPTTSRAEQSRAERIQLDISCRQSWCAPLYSFSITGIALTFGTAFTPFPIANPTEYNVQTPYHTSPKPDLSHTAQHQKKKAQHNLPSHYSKPVTLLMTSVSSADTAREADRP